jgi:hypothetical protein
MVIGAGAMVHPEIGALCASTNGVVRSRGWDYRVVPEPLARGSGELLSLRPASGSSPL